MIIEDHILEIKNNTHKIIIAIHLELIKNPIKMKIHHLVLVNMEKMQIMYYAK